MKSLLNQIGAKRIAGRVVVVLCLWSATARGAEPVAGTGAIANTIQGRLIAGLSAVDPRAREQAGESLRARGQAAMPALEAASRDRDPAAALAAREILKDIQAGLTPVGQPELVDFVKHYRESDALEKATVPYKIADRGTAGLRVVIGLYCQTRDADLLGPLLEHRHESAVLMLGAGMDAEAEPMVGPSRDEDIPGYERTSGDPIAFLVTSGKLGAARAELKRRPLTPSNAGWLYAMDRASGNFPAALEDARKVPDRPGLLDDILFRQHDWRTLASQLESGAADMETGEERFGYLCKCYELMGDAEAARKTSRRLIALADIDLQRGGGSPLSVADNLFLCGFPDQAIDVLVSITSWARPRGICLGGSGSRNRLRWWTRLEHNCRPNCQPCDRTRPSPSASSAGCKRSAR